MNQPLQQQQPKGSAALQYIPYLFLTGAVIGAIGCLGRADYNLPVFLFGYVAFNYLRGHKHLVAAIFLFSVIVDVLWFFFIYLNVWMRDEYVNLAKWETGIHKMCLVVTIINLVLKVVSVILTYLYDSEVRNTPPGGNNPAGRPLA